MITSGPWALVSSGAGRIGDSLQGLIGMVGKAEGSMRRIRYAEVVGAHVLISPCVILRVPVVPSVYARNSCTGNASNRLQSQWCAIQYILLHVFKASSIANRVSS